MSDIEERGSDPVEDLALAAFRMVKEKLAFELDFTPETLPVLDHYLRELRAEGIDEKVASVIGPCAGAYFGEVVRRSLPGLRWAATGDDYAKWRIEASHVFMCFHPIGMALEALYGEPLDGFASHVAVLPGDRDAVDRSLDAAGPVRDDDFVRLAVRHEVIEQTLSVLTAQEQQRGEPRTFGPDVYDATIGIGEPGIEA
jgi:hypothetical protein